MLKSGNFNFWKQVLFFLVLETCYPWKFSIPSVGREYEDFLEQHIAYEYELTMGLLFSPSSTHNPCTRG